jgi:hypothetical protein
VVRSGGVAQTESADAVQSTQRYVLEKAAKKLVGVQRHDLTLAVSAAFVGEGDGAVIAAVMALSESAVRWT